MYMESQHSSRGQINFRLFGVNVSIHPMSWVFLAIIGGGLGVSNKDSLVQMLCFVVAGMLCLLVHEFGHALVGRRLGSGNADITIAGLGGITRHEYAPTSRMNYFMTVLAGPLASLLLGITGGVLLGLQLGDVGAGIELSLALPLPGDALSQHTKTVLVLNFLDGGIPMVVLKLYTALFMVCFWWSVFNLLPILPLDGGRLLATLLGNNRVVCMVGLVICVVLLLCCLFTGSWFNMMIVGYLGWLNWQFLRAGM